jgi:hydrogenase maturation protease
MNKNTLLIGLGNPILGDDGVGWKVVEYLQQNCSLPSNVETDCLALGGLSLMERLVGYEQAILVDAIVTRQYPIGHVMHLELDDLPSQGAGHLSSSHDTTLQVAMNMGRTMGASLPEKIIIVAIESQNVYDFSEQLTPAVAASISKAAEIVLKILAGTLQPPAGNQV